jgi:hypothetical protein
MDLYVSSVAIPDPVVAEIGKAVVTEASTLTVSWEVRNRGSEKSDVTTLGICMSANCDGTRKSIELRALAPGEKQSGTMSIVLPANYAGDTRIEASFSSFDADLSNNDKDVPILVERPNLKTGMTLLSSESRMGDTVKAVVISANTAYVAAAPASANVFCMEFNDACSTQAPIVHYSIPALAAGASHTDTVRLVIPRATHHYAEDVSTERLLTCNDDNESIRESNESDNCTTASVTVIPNFGFSCNLTTLAVGGTASGVGTASDCALRAYHDRADIYAVQLVANTVYTVTFPGTPVATGDIGILTDRGASVDSDIFHRTTQTWTFTVPTSGSYNLAVAMPEGFAYTVRLAQQ